MATSKQKAGNATPRIVSLPSAQQSAPTATSPAIWLYSERTQEKGPHIPEGLCGYDARHPEYNHQLGSGQVQT